MNISEGGASVTPDGFMAGKETSKLRLRRSRCTHLTTILITSHTEEVLLRMLAHHSYAHTIRICSTC